MVTYNKSSEPAGLRNGNGLFRRTFEAMMGARARQANQFVNHYLSSMDTETLAGLGYDAEQIRRMTARRTSI
ncbi:hypothetical protein HDIA_2892 [Hartmannibacter diazotrophicus]|uniref:DUF1127 domain-containing protein n=1 Tax=Hartmannibacter diazotrophicus TaxID=1482074 RepID=A0A2C9D853_9HYPH|nr:hypothetical protein [Hartmannibacter diazotrophicus]SON56433.1 hypothetical protein HDIA_2892 [Hartmannibacter diazotrophicus]